MLSWWKPGREAWGDAVARDHKGHVFLTVGRQLPLCSSVEEAETAVAVMGLTEFAKYFNGSLFLATDCDGVVRELKAEERCISAYHACVTDAKNLLMSYVNTEIIVISRGKTSWLMS